MKNIDDKLRSRLKLSHTPTLLLFFPSSHGSLSLFLSFSYRETETYLRAKLLSLPIPKKPTIHTIYIIPSLYIYIENILEKNFISISLTHTFHKAHKLHTIIYILCVVIFYLIPTKSSTSYSPSLSHIAW